MKKIFLFIVVLFVFSCGENNLSSNSSESESSNSTTILENTVNREVESEKFRIENILVEGTNYYLDDMKKVTTDLDNIFSGGTVVNIDDFFVHVNKLEKNLKKASDYFSTTTCKETGNSDFDSECTNLLKLANEDLQLKQQWVEQVNIIMTKNGISNKDADNFTKKTENFIRKQEEFSKAFTEFKKEF